MKIPRLLSAVFFSIPILLSGCTGSLRTEYGASEGYDARQSPASVSLFRNLCESDGHRTVLVRSFSPRAMTKLNAIVWTPDSFELHRPSTYEWLDRWLMSGDRTLVYVGRDFSPLADYWSQVCDGPTTKEISSQQKLDALQQLAEHQSALDKLRSGVRGTVATPWFLSDHSVSREERIHDLSGPWADDIDAKQTRLFLRSHAIGYDGQTKQSLIDQFDNESKDSSSMPQNSVGFDFVWQSTDEEMLKIVKSFTDEDMPQLEVLLGTSDNKPLIAEITRNKWGRSRVIFVANGSLVTNISLLNSENRRIAKTLATTLPRENIGFLTGVIDPPVRKDDSAEQQKGFEMLTIWPLNVITLHAVFLGMLVLLAVFPIFGRAKRLPQNSTHDFGQHVDAVGALLERSGDRFYALATIADYFRHVRKEPTSPWAQIDSSAQQEPKSPFAESPTTPESHVQVSSTNQSAR